jgi:hypothetical protein
VAVVGPYVLFAIAGAFLWTLRRTLATLLIALGFAATLVGQVAGILAQHHHVFPILTHYATLVGLWLAAVGMIWHAIANR